MKKSVRGIWAFVLLVLMAAMLTSAAGAADKGLNIYINGDRLNIPRSFGAPFYDESNRLQIPMRYIIESCGYSVTWEGATNTAVVGTKAGDIRISVGSNIMKTPAGDVTMNTSAVAYDGRTYIPLRYTLEALGFKVDWAGGAEADRVDITGTIGANSTRKVLTAAEVSEKASPATFYIEAKDVTGTSFAGGSGFFIESTGLGITNYHVIDGASFADIVMTDGTKYSMGPILYYDIDRDIVVFRAYRVENMTITYLTGTPYLNMAMPSSIHNGDVVYAIGSPLGLQNSITNGLVSNKERVLPGETLSYIQTSAPISHGNSGGPLLNEYGEVIGVNSASLTAGQNLNLAIPISALSNVNYFEWRTPQLWDFCEERFKETLTAETVDFTERIIYEEDPDNYNPIMEIRSGDSIGGTFSDYFAMDYYWFYTPIKVNVEIMAAGISDRDYDSRLDSAAKQNGFKSWDDYILGSFGMTLDLQYNGETYIQSERSIDGGGHPLQTISATLEPGYYFINTFQAINDESAWDGREYFVYLNMSPAGENDTASSGTGGDKGDTGSSGNTSGNTTGNTTSGKYVYYSDGPWVPDFGALNGLKPAYYNNNGTSSMRTYDISSFDLVNGYIEVLENDGFIFDVELSEGMSGTAPMVFVKNGDITQAVTIDINSYNQFEVFFMLK